MKRRQAKSGELIEIVEPKKTNGEYRKGDILEVQSKAGTEFVKCYGIEKFINNKEYQLIGVFK